MADDRRRGNPLEESPNTPRQHAAYNMRGPGAKACGHGKCHRKQTAGGNSGKGEKARQELTARRASSGAR